MAETLLEEVNPNGNIQAVVEADDIASYFYLFGAPDTEVGMKTVWIRNHTPAPEVLEVERLRSGSPSRNPARHCRHPAGQPALAPEDLRVVWLPEGNGAALYEGEEIIAIIPPWSGTQGFFGYARDTIGNGPVAWELGPDNVLLDRFAAAQSYWESWADEEFWPTFQSTQIALIEKVFGRHSKYYAIDGGEWPTKAMVRFAWKGCTVLITVGVAMRPQPDVERSTESPEQLRRIELGAVLPGSWSEESIRAFGSYLSGQTNLPWDQYTWLGPGHTLPCDAWQNPKFSMALLQLQHPEVPRVSLDDFLGDPVNVLWFIPISEAERQVAIDKGSQHLVSQLPNDRWQRA